MSDTLTLLIVDDNPSLAGAMADVLELKGFAVRSATSGADALAILGSHPVDILLTDVRMPDMNGVALPMQPMISSSKEWQKVSRPS
jgi:CheY-like chemotaxis protein